MHLICASYYNIGPFENQIITVILKSGKYLIKAPIGSGKSFLFFDGLVYALYGYSKRDMLNVNSKTGRTKILFANDDKELFLIERPLNGKKGTKLYKVNTDYQKLNTELEGKIQDTISYGVDFSEYIDHSLLESYDFHTATEMQQSIESLLPPRTVFLNRHILMQDSENIFELQPKNRIDVLKLMFGLDMIDTVKEKIGEKKNELRGQLKVLSESSHIEEQYKPWYGELYSGYTTIIGILSSLLDTQDGTQLQEVFQKVGLGDFISDPLSSNVGSLHENILDRDFGEREKLIELYRSQYADLQSALRTTRQQLDQAEEQKRSKNTKLCELEANIQQLIQQHPTLIQSDAGSNESVLQDLVNKKQDIVRQIQSIDNNIPIEQWNTLIQYQGQPAQKTLTEYRHMLDSLKQLGISEKQGLDTVEAKIATFRAKLENRGQELEAAKQQLLLIKKTEFERTKTAIEHDIVLTNNAIAELSRGFKTIKDQETQLRALLTSLGEQAKDAEHCHCDIEHDHCPIVETMKTSTLQKIEAQVAQAKAQLATLQTKEQELNSQETSLQTHLLQQQNELGLLDEVSFVPTSTAYQAATERVEQLERGPQTPADKLEEATLDAEKHKIIARLEQIRSDYKTLSFSGLEELTATYKELGTTIAGIDNQILIAQKELHALQTTMQQYHSLVAQKEQIASNIHEIDLLTANLSNQLLEYEKQMKNGLYTALPKLLESTKILTQLVVKGRDLYQEKRRIEHKSREAKEQLDIASNLHSIFSKELTLYVLQSYIPVLNEYINAFLSKVVDFELLISVNDEGDELILEVEDMYGKREVKSLSGGQRTVLRLCRILATSVVFANSFLLLDETINNIDAGIIGKVAELLTDYVKQHAITFYTVTHSEQIQQMSIWDGIITVRS